MHICDWRAETRNDFDRALPGEGIMDLPGLFGALEPPAPSSGSTWRSSRTTAVHRPDFPDSLWKQDPADVIARSKAGFDAAWEARKAPA